MCVCAGLVNAGDARKREHTFKDACRAEGAPTVALITEKTVCQVEGCVGHLTEKVCACMMLIAVHA